MAEISAAAVKALREKTKLPVMKCKWALEQTGGDEQAAIELLRKEGAAFSQQRDRETSSGRIAVWTDFDRGVAAMIELRCETDPVAKNDSFIELANTLARQLATGPGANTPEELLDQPSGRNPGETLRDFFTDINNQIRETFRIGRMLRVQAPCGGYVHFTGKLAALVEVEGGTEQAARDVAIHVVGMNPEALTPEQLPQEKVEQVRQKYAAINEKAVAGALKKLYRETVLLEQPFLMDESKTVGQFAQEQGMKILRYVRWELGEEGSQQGS